MELQVRHSVWKELFLWQKKKSVIKSSRQKIFSFHPSATHPTKPYQSPPWREKNKCLAGESAKGLIGFLPLSKVKDETVSHELKVVWEKVFSGKAHWNKLVEILLYWPWDLSSGTCLCFRTKDTHLSCRHCGVGLLWPLLLTMPESALWWERKTDCGIPLRGRSSSGSWEFQKRFSGSWKLPCDLHTCAMACMCVHTHTSGSTHTVF